MSANDAPLFDDARRPGAAQRRAGSARSPHDAAELTFLVHELSNLIDGSLRWISLASADLPVLCEGPEALERARSQVERVRTNLERMGGLVSAAMRTESVPIGSPVLGAGNVTLAEAMDHAADVVRDEASEAGVEVRLEVTKDAGTAPAGGLYAVILNGLRNAVEATATQGGGLVVLGASVDAGSVRVAIADEGPGVDGLASDEWAFEHGNSTKGNGRGVGLALAARIVRDAGGSIRLRNRDAGVVRGAVLEVELPTPRIPTSIG